MAYTTNQNCREIDVRIPLTAENIEKLINETGGISIDKDYGGSGRLSDSDGFLVKIGGGEYYLEGRYKNGIITLNKEQDGSYCNCDSGMEYILKTFKGSGTIEETGEDGEHDIVMFTEGKRKTGRVVFD